MKLLSAQDILQAPDLETLDVSVPEWGGTVRLREMTGSERDAFEVGRMQGRGKNATANLQNFRAALLVHCIVDENGKRLFNKQQIDALGAKGSGVISRLYDAAAKLNGITKEDEAELTDTFQDEPLETQPVQVDAGAGRTTPPVFVDNPNE